MQNVSINTHPIIQDRLTKIRDKNTSHADFRKYLSEIAVFLCVDATRELPVNDMTVQTPLALYDGVAVDGIPLIVPILRAGLAFSEGMARLLPQADTGHIGLARDEETHEPVEYLNRLPSNLNRPIFVVDPMLATGGSMIATLDILIRERANVDDIVIVTLLCAPEGVKTLQEKYPTIPIYTAAIDDHLNEDAFIVPGLGDAGDRFFGTD
jgi:uracil phosphoribosyltransferase